MNTQRKFSTQRLFKSQNQFKQPKKELIQQVLRNKIFTYTHFRIKVNSIASSNKKKSKKRQKIISNSRVMPQFDTIQQLIQNQKDIVFVFRQKIQSNFQQGFYFMMKLIKISLDFQCQIFSKQLIIKKSALISALLFVSETLFELGYLKLSFYFCSLVILIAQIYKDCFSIGKALLIMSKTFRKNQKFKQAIILCKKALEYLWMQKSSTCNDLQIQVYSELSFNFLQFNQPEQSKIFAQKYEIGYIQPENSKILTLSRQLVSSIQARIPTWKKVKMKTFELVIKLKFGQLIQQNQQKFRAPIDQNQLLKIFNINYFDLFQQTFMKHQMFFYQIPLPLEIKKTQLSVFSKRRIVNTSSSKFISKNRSKSVGSIKVLKVQNQKVQQKIILNYRGVSFSRKKLYHMLEALLYQFENNHNSMTSSKQTIVQSQVKIQQLGQ